MDKIIAIIQLTHRMTLLINEIQTLDILSERRDTLNNEIIVISQQITNLSSSLDNTQN